MLQGCVRATSSPVSAGACVQIARLSFFFVIERGSHCERNHSALASYALGFQVYVTMPGLNACFSMSVIIQTHKKEKSLNGNFQEFPAISLKIESIQWSSLAGSQTQNVVFHLLLGFYTMESPGSWNFISVNSHQQHMSPTANARLEGAHTYPHFLLPKYLKRMPF